MVHLDNITLCAMGSTNIQGMVNALVYSSHRIRFGSIKLVTSGVFHALELSRNTYIKVVESEPMHSIDEWNYQIVFNLGGFIDTEYAILIHPDGYIVHPYSWQDRFYDYDYVGAPWPLPTDNYSYRTPDGDLVRVGNSVSLRSKRILDLPKKLKLEWGIYYGNTNEDGFLCVHNKKVLEENGCRFAPLEVAKWFSRETEIPENREVRRPFAFHKHAGRNYKYRNFELEQTPYIPL